MNVSMFRSMLPVGSSTQRRCIFDHRPVILVPVEPLSTQSTQVQPSSCFAKVGTKLSVPKWVFLDKSSLAPRTRPEFQTNRAESDSARAVVNFPSLNGAYHLHQMPKLLSESNDRRCMSAPISLPLRLCSASFRKLGIIPARASERTNSLSPAPAITTLFFFLSGSCRQ
jgi:hypothetical protein